MSRLIAVAVCGAMLCTAAAQQMPVPRYAEPQPIPAERMGDFYAIYSQLLPGDQIEWGNVPRTQWLVEEVTKAVALDNACVSGGTMVGSMNPHKSIKAPEARQAEFAEVLADFDAHCHDRYKLEASKFRLALPVRLLDEEARKLYVNGVMHYMPPANDIMHAPATPDEFRGAAGMHSFTAVYFNRAHTLAMTRLACTAEVCAGTGSGWYWSADREDGNRCRG